LRNKHINTKKHGWNFLRTWSHIRGRCYNVSIHAPVASTGDTIADRIREALAVNPDGLSKNQIRRLFHGHVHCNRIDAALEQLLLLDVASCHSEFTGGRPSTLWLATAEEEQEENEAWEADLEEPSAEEDEA
jgi:hypothetical protein